MYGKLCRTYAHTPNHYRFPRTQSREMVAAQWEREPLAAVIRDYAIGALAALGWLVLVVSVCLAA